MESIAKKLFLSGLLSLALTGLSSAQSLDFNKTENWKLVGAEIEINKIDDRQVLHIAEAPGSRMVTAKDVMLQDGIIELDIKAEGKYVGLTFRVQSDDVYEAIYFRPRNVNHKDPVFRNRTVQYIAKPGYDWFYLRDRYPGVYESDTYFKKGEWFHVKLELKGKEASVYINNEKQASLKITLINKPATGSVGVWTGNTSSGTFANMKITKYLTTDTNNAVTYTAEQNFMWETFKNRRSARKFKPDPIPEQHLITILDMARTAPTSGNQQPWKFMVIRDRDKLNELKEACIDLRMSQSRARGLTDEAEVKRARASRDEYFTNFLSAPVYVIVMTDTLSRYPSYNIYDGSLASGYLMTAARALGYGTVFSQDSVPWEVLKEVFNIPGHYERICFTPIGVPVEWPEAHGKKPLEDFIIWEKFLTGWNYTAPIVRTAIELSDDALKLYPGSYTFDEETTVVITRMDNQLGLAFSGRPVAKLYAEEQDMFFMKSAMVQVEFKRENGKISGLTFIQAGQSYEAVRKAQ